MFETSIEAENKRSPPNRRLNGSMIQNDKPEGNLKCAGGKVSRPKAMNFFYLMPILSYLVAWTQKALCTV